MSNEFDYLIDEGRRITDESDNEQVFIGKEDQVDLDAEAIKTATNVIGGIQYGVGYMWPNVKIDNTVYKQGIIKFTPIARKHCGGELPPWMLFIKQYQDEFMAGVWFAGFAMEVKKQVEAERKKQEEKPENNTDIDTEKVNN